MDARTFSTNSVTNATATRYDFASDNTAGICPEAWRAMEEANRGALVSYGEDAWTQRASDLIRALFNYDAEIYFVFNGTAANSLALASLCQSYHSVICHERAHVETDECGAPEFFSNGSKLLSVNGEGAKISPESVSRLVLHRSDIHYPKPRVVTITQSTELGTVYSVGEVRALGEVTKELDLALHMDGARFANAAASLGVAPEEFTWKAGVDVLCRGGTKNGLGVGEAVVFFDRSLATDFAYRCKQAGQLASKMRYLAAPWVGLLEGHTWLRNGRNANDCARRLAEGLVKLPHVRVVQPVEANAVFAEIPGPVTQELRRRGWYFYTFIGASCARLMCSWATTYAIVDEFLADAAAASASYGA
ncbi:threonine aldolase [Verrucomicrobia bacterium LW23]|nr:threonine aldolase [Verrucomicrobia bacterium LW23]